MRADSDEVNGFVVVGDDIGRLVSVDGTGATVEFFDAPVADGLIRRCVPLADVKSTTLERQCRVWWHDSNRWRTGRVVDPPDNVSDTYLVALPDQEAAELTGDRLQVRWSRPLEDPVRLLMAGTTETRFFHRHRSSFVHALFDQRSAAEGLAGIASSGVELHRHQVRAARRVLLDPIRRYLLADEVGLGKTIEAGMVIRQTLLDRPNARVLVLAPDPLVPQWERELDSKFRVQGLRGGWVDIEPHSSLESTEPDTRNLSLVVVDEAHRLASADADPLAYQRLQTLAVKSPGLLLLTATPVRSNEDAFLRLLHLLEPETYRLEDLDSFRARIENRDAVGSAVTLLADDIPVVLMSEGVELLQGAFPADADLEAMLEELREALEANDEERARSEARSVKNYVSETYRLHRRLIRARRNRQLQQLFPVRHRQRSATWALTDVDERRRAIVEALDRFRSELVACDELPRETVLRAVAARCCAATPAVAGLRDALAGTGRDDLLAEEVEAVDALVAHPLGKELGEWLSEALETAQLDDRIEQATDWAWSNVGRRKLAAFTSYTSVASATRDRMRERYGEHRVAALLRGMTADELEGEAHRARTDDLCVLLVCDSVAEEGWNLQFAHEVLHLDLPWHTNRLEQRLGRFDRFTPDQGEVKPVLSTIFADEAELDRLTGQWTRLVDEGFDVFRQSSASLQYVLPEREASALGRALDHGFAAISRDVEDEHTRMTDMRRHIDGQDLLDAIEDSEDDDRFFEQLVGVDRRSGEIRSSFDDWVCKALNFAHSPTDPPWSLKISKRNPPLLTESTVRRLGIDHFNQKYVFDRRESEGFGLVRPGEPLVDALLDLCLEDDRGLAFAVHLDVPSMPPEATPQPVFFFDVVIASRSPEFDDLTSEEIRAIDRRRLSYFSPIIESIWLLPGRGEPPTKIQDELESDRAINLGKHPEMFAEFIAGMDWAATCRAAEEEAKKRVLARGPVQKRLAQAVSMTESQRRLLEAQLAARSHSLGEVADLRSVAREFDRVGQLVADPVARIDNCGVVFLGPKL